MTREDRFELRLAEWLEDGPFEAPERGVDAAIAHAWAHPRGRSRWLPAGLRPAPHAPAPVPVPLERVRPPFRFAWVVLAALLTVALVATALVASRRLAVAPLPGNGLLAFSYAGDIWTVAPGGVGAARDITATTGEIETAPAWSPDGEWLAVRVQRGSMALFRIDLMRPDGSERQTISWTTSSTQGGLAWSPDSRTVAVGFGETETAYVTLFDAAGLEQPRILDQVPGSSPVFSPDGERIAFLGIPPGEGRREVYLAELDDGSTVRLTGPATLSATLLSHPAWADGGRTIVFDAGSPVDGTLVHHVYAIGVDGSGLRRVGPAEEWDEQGSGTAPVVAPDGHTIAFAGGGAVRVTTLDSVSSAAELGEQVGPDGIEWSPDGRLVAYLDWSACDPGAGGAGSTRACLRSVVVVDLDRQAAVPVWTAPSWTPGGGAIPPSFTWDISWQPLPERATEQGSGS